MRKKMEKPFIYLYIHSSEKIKPNRKRSVNSNDVNM